MTAHITQEFQIVDVAQPVGIVDHQGVGRAVTEGEVVGEDALDAGNVLGNRILGHQLAGFVLEGRIADHAGAAAHQRNRLVPGLLEPVQHHDLDQAACMKARSRRIEADIGRHGFLGQQFVEATFIGNLMNEATLGKRAKKIGFETGHSFS